MADPTRDVAYALLTAVLDRHRPLEEALDALPPGDGRDRAAGHRLAAVTLRRLGSLDAVLEPFLSKAPPLPVRHILRLGAAGLLLADTPAHAGVTTAVSLARAQGLASFTGLVNAVLRRVAEVGQAALEGLDGPRLDTPAWLWSDWVAAFGAQARDIAVAHALEAPIDLTLRPGADAAVPGAVPLPTGSLRLAPGTRVTALPGFEDGAFWVQDAAAALPARLLAARPGERVVDLCAAPGGKTAQLAATGARVVAVERDGGRLGRLRENLARLRLEAEVVEADATVWRPDGLFDAVLLDAPCTATGTLRRHPDVAHLKRPKDVVALCRQSDRLLAAAAAMLRSGGRLVFAVCSLQPGEGPERTLGLAALGLRPDPFGPDELADLPEGRTPEGWLRTHPGMWADRGGMDGFFAARFVKG